jgi:hypothetical protein
MAAGWHGVHGIDDATAPYADLAARVLRSTSSAVRRQGAALSAAVPTPPASAPGLRPRLGPSGAQYGSTMPPIECPVYPRRWPMPSTLRWSPWSGCTRCRPPRGRDRPSRRWSTSMRRTMTSWSLGSGLSGVVSGALIALASQACTAGGRRARALRSTIRAAVRVDAARSTMRARRTECAHRTSATRPARAAKNGMSIAERLIGDDASRA